jgi:hypothetical protein
MGEDLRVADGVREQGVSHTTTHDELDDRSVRESPLSTLLEHPTASDIDPKRVRDMFEQSKVWVLGDAAAQSQPGESDILHFTIDDDNGKESVICPAFTSKHALREALTLNSEWQHLDILEVDGGPLLTNLGADVALVIDPWTPLEYPLWPEEKEQIVVADTTAT